MSDTSRPRIVCLCGSTRFGEAFAEANLKETLKGHIVLSIGCYTHSDEKLRDRITPEVKKALDELHLRKIELADEILVLNARRCVQCGTSEVEIPRCGTVGAPLCDYQPYVGESTRNEILHAYACGKRIRWLNPPGCFTAPDGACIGAGCMHDTTTMTTT